MTQQSRKLLKKSIVRIDRLENLQTGNIWHNINKNTYEKFLPERI